jgi:hypothetical protein
MEDFNIVIKVFRKSWEYYSFIAEGHLNKSLFKNSVLPQREHHTSPLQKLTL